MSTMAVDEMLKVLEGYKKGLPIEYRNCFSTDSNWEYISNPSFNFSNFEYRIAVNSYKPYGNAMQFVKDLQYSGTNFVSADDHIYHGIKCINDSGIVLEMSRTDSQFVSYEKLRNFKFSNGNVCGIKQ